MCDSSSASWADHQVRHLIVNANAAWLHCAMATAPNEALSLLNLSRSICNTMDMQVRILPGEGSNYRM